MTKAAAEKKGRPGGANTGSGKGNNLKPNITQTRGESNGNKASPPGLFQIRHGGCVIFESGIHNLGYTPEQLKDMARAGYYLYRDGKRVKLCDIT